MSKAISILPSKTAWRPSDACKRKVLVRQEPHLCGPETQGGEALVLERVRGEGEDRLETGRSHGGIVGQDLLLSPAGAEKAEEELHGEPGTLHHGFAGKDVGIGMDVVAPVHTKRLPPFGPCLPPRGSHPGLKPGALCQCPFRAPGVGSSAASGRSRLLQAGGGGWMRRGKPGSGDRSPGHNVETIHREAWKGETVP